MSRIIIRMETNEVTVKDSQKDFSSDRKDSDR